MKVQETESSGRQSEGGRSAAPWVSIWRWRPEWLISTAVILTGAAIATAPLRLHNFSCGHDFDFHLVSWIDALRSWRQGILDPQWTASPNYGAGEPRFVFYPPLTWMLGALLGRFLNWGHAPLALTFLVLAATGIATRALARQVMSEGPATLAGCFALFSGYTLFSVYERSAYAELSGGFWIPLLILLILREGQRDHGADSSWFRRVFGGSALPLAVVIAGAWLSNAPVGVMASYLLAAVALALAVLSKSWIPVVRAVVGEALGLGLAAFYLVPAAWEQRWVAIRQATDDPGLLIENSFLFGHHPHPEFELHDIELWKVSSVAVSMIAVTFIALFICWRRGRLPGDRRWWIPLALIPVAVLLLQLPISLFVWNALPKLRFLQFPWRLLVVLEAPMGIFVANAMWMTTRTGRALVIAASSFLFIGSAGFAGYAFYQNCAPEDSVVGMLAALRAGRGSEGTDEYAPRGADNSLVPTDLPAACLVSSPATPLGAGDPDLTPQWAPEQGSCLATFPFDPPIGFGGVEHKRVHAFAANAGYLILRLRDYPAWSVRVNGAPVSIRPAREDGLMAVPVVAGPVAVSVDWTTTSDVVIGRRMSFLAALLVTVLSLLVRKRAQPKLK
jgi:hypothetical protein